MSEQLKSHSNASSTIVINGQHHPLDDPANITEVLNLLGYRQGEYAVAVNGEFIPRTKHGSHIITNGDMLDVLTPIEGG